MPLTTAGRNALIDSGKAVFTHVTAFSDVGQTEITTTRQAVTWGAASGGIAANTGALTIPVNAGVTVQTIGIYSASTAGTQYAYLPYHSTAPPKGFGSVVTTAGNMIQSNGHGLTTDDRVFVWAVNGESLPSGLSATTLYFVLAAGLTADVFALSTTSGGSAVDITALGELGFAKTVPNTFASAGNLTIAIGAITLDGTMA